MRTSIYNNADIINLLKNFKPYHWKYDWLIVESPPPLLPTFTQHTDLGVDSSVSSSCSGPSSSAAAVVGADPSAQSSPSGQGTGSDPLGYLWSLSLQKTNGDDSSGSGWTVRNSDMIIFFQQKKMDKNWKCIILLMYMFIFLSVLAFKNISSNRIITMTNYQ